MLSDLFLFGGFGCLVVASFIMSLVLGLILVGVGMVIIAFALADGWGPKWRS